MKFNFFKNEFVNTTYRDIDPFIVGSDVILSYGEVYKLHLNLKEKLSALNIPKGHPVCIYGEKEAMFPVVMITLMSMNIPYVPIDAIMPSGRISSIRAQTKSKVLINCSAKTCEVEFEINVSKNLDVVAKEKEIKFNLLENGNDPIRYILFTSGSTGTPKGVQITAGALNSFVDWYLTWPGIDQETVFMNQAPFSFDVSLCDLIGAFANGCKAVFNDYSILKNGALFLNRLNEHKANTIVCTPSFIQMYLSVPEFNQSNFPLLKQIIFMGEELHATNVKKLKRAFPSLRVVNAYGPTEATVVSTYIELTDEILGKHSKSLPIGYCRPKGEIVVLEKDSTTGVGELGITGPNLSIGYLNDKEKTGKAFIRSDSKRIYKTGDVGYIEDSLIFYLGRNDSQVKLNGYRIELDEISNVLLAHPNIKNAAAVPLTSGNVTKKIICFVILTDKTVFRDLNQDIKNYLLSSLPSYMIPSEFIVCESFPMNANYKTDKKALLESYLNA
jgi:D-alanine--poly(phosphoribitol) ligase subunit 1